MGVKTRGQHALTSWRNEHSVALLCELRVEQDGRTPCRRWKGRQTKQETAEFGEKVHHKVSQKGTARDEKLQAKWEEGYFVVKAWSASEAVIIGDEGIRRVAAIRREGPHRRLDAEGVSRIHFFVDEGNNPRFLNQFNYKARVHMLALRREDLVEHGVTERFLGCQEPAGNRVRCLPRLAERVSSATARPLEGQWRAKPQEECENQRLAKKLEKHDLPSGPPQVRTQGSGHQAKRVRLLSGDFGMPTVRSGPNPEPSLR